MAAIMRAFIQQLAQQCGRYCWQPKCVLVPNHATGVLIGERLFRSGTNWANLRFVTTEDLAVEIAGPRLATDGISILEESWGAALVLNLLLDLPASIPAYFRPMADGPGMADALWAAVRDLRLAGCCSADLTAAALSSSGKRSELKALVRAYEEHLAKSLSYDPGRPLRAVQIARRLLVAPFLFEIIHLDGPMYLRRSVEVGAVASVP